ncbi:MAG: hypothetical protein AAGD35_23690 [Actinomycetota bacterium]
MRHRRFYIQNLWTSGLAVPPTGGDLVVASRPETTDLDWELIYRSSETWRLRQEPYDLDMEGPEGRFGGPAILVRSDGRSHVFRGVGALNGFDAASLEDAAGDATGLDGDDG